MHALHDVLGYVPDNAVNVKSGKMLGFDYLACKAVAFAQRYAR